MDGLGYGCHGGCDISGRGDVLTVSEGMIKVTEQTPTLTQLKGALKNDQIQNKVCVRPVQCPKHAFGANIELRKSIFTKSAHWAIWSSICDVCLSVRPCACVSVCLMPSASVFSPEASHWSSDHMTSSRPLIGRPFFPTVPPHPHGLSTRGYSEEPCQPTRKSLRKKSFSRLHTRIPDCIHGLSTRGNSKSLVDRLGRALKARSYSGLPTWISHAWEMLDYWTGALVNQLVEH